MKPSDMHVVTGTLRMRKLRASEVEFTVSVEAEDTPVRGNVCATDEPELDKAEEDRILDRLDRGEVEAWCGVVVVAEWRGFKGHASLWGCSLDDSYTAATVAEEHGLREEALDDLNATIANTLNELAPLVES